jgi:putative ABC transport system permease protein
VAAAPRAFNAISEAGLRAGVAAASVDQRDLEAGVGGRLQSGGDVGAIVDTAGLNFQESLAPSIQALIDHRTFVIDSVRYVFPAEVNKHLTVRYQSGIEGRVRVVAGRLPQQIATPGLEVAISQATADALGVKLGQTLTLRPDPSDRLVLPRAGPPSSLAFQVVGLITSLNPDDDYWYGDQRLEVPSVSTSLDMPPQIFGTALLAGAAYPDLLRYTAPALVHYFYRYFVNPSRLLANQADQLGADLQRLLATYSPQLSGGATDTSVTTGLADLLSSYFHLRGLALSLLSLPVMGLLVVTVAVIVLASALVAERRHQGIALLRGRGGSPAQILTAQAVEGAVLCLPAAAAAYVLAVVLVAAEPSAWSLWAAGGVALLMTAVMVGTALPWTRGGLGGLERTEVRRPRLSVRRVVLDAFVVALAGVGIYLLRQRGLAGVGAAGAGAFDPFLAAAPALLGLATGLIALRLYGLPLGLLARAAARRRGAVVVLGLRRLSRQPTLAAASLLVLLLAVAVGTFAASMVTTIETGQVRTAWERVGADYRVEPPSDYQGLDSRLDLSHVPGVEATASAFRQDLGSFIIFAVEPAAYQRVTAGTPIDARMPSALLASPASSGNPIPVIVSTLSPTGSPLSPGQSLRLPALSQDITFVVSAVRGAFGGLPADRPFVVMALDALQAAEPANPPVRSELYLRAPASAEPAIRAELQRQYRDASLESRAADYSQVHVSPLVAGTVGGFRAGVAVAAGLSALAVIAGLALTAPRRALEVAYLRIAGLSRRQVAGLLAVEQGPPAVLALCLGVGLGVATGQLIAPGVDLTPFTGPGYPVRPGVDWLAVTAGAVALMAVVAVAVAVTGVLTARHSLRGVMKWES